MPNPICVDCQCEFRSVKNGTIVVTMTGLHPYQMWRADTWGCPGCKKEIVIGFGQKPMAEHWQPDFNEKLDAERQRGSRIEYDYERPTPKKIFGWDAASKEPSKTVWFDADFHYNLLRKKE